MYRILDSIDSRRREKRFVIDKKRCIMIQTHRIQILIQFHNFILNSRGFSSQRTDTTHIVYNIQNPHGFCGPRARRILRDSRLTSHVLNRVNFSKT